MVEKEKNEIRVYAYDPEINNFRFFGSIKEWEEKIDYEGAKKYIKKDLVGILKLEFPLASEVYKKKETGFFSLSRIIFPVITVGGALYQGEDKTSSAVKFIEDYMGKIDPKYREIGEAIYCMYRHGLIHQQTPKIFKVNEILIGWEITFNRNNHLRPFKSPSNVIVIPICPEKLYEDFIQALELYIKDFDDPEKRENLVGKFKKGFSKMAIPEDRSHSEKWRKIGEWLIRQLSFQSERN